MGNIFKAYTDGACTLNKVNGDYEKGCGGTAGVIIRNEEMISYFSKSSTKTTNNEMELLAILMAMYKIYQIKDFDAMEDIVEIYSDSAYSINCIMTWAKSWEKNGWTRGKKHEEIKNLELIKAIYYFKDKFKNFTLIKVKGHSDDKWNNYVDKLAVTGKKVAETGNITTVKIDKLIAKVGEIIK